MKNRTSLLIICSLSLMAFTLAEKCCPQPNLVIYPEANLLFYQTTKDNLDIIYRYTEGKLEKIYALNLKVEGQCYYDESRSPQFIPSPDRKKLLYVTTTNCDVEEPQQTLESRKIYLLDIDGSSATKRLLATGYRARWSPDGRWISFFGIVNNVRGLFIIQPDGSNPKCLGNWTTGEYSWSHDSKYLAIATDLLFNIEVSTGLIRNMGIEMRTYNTQIEWSPDDFYITMLRGYTITPEDTTDYSLLVRDLYVTSPTTQTSNLLNLTHTAEQDESYFIWSPNSSKIAFLAHGKEGYYTKEVYKVDRDGKNIINISQDTWDTHLMSWSPDGERIFFRSFEDSEFVTHSRRYDGTDLKKFSLGEFIFSIDGQFAASAAGNTIYLAKSDGSNIKSMETGCNDCSTSLIAWTK